MSLALPFSPLVARRDAFRKSSAGVTSCTGILVGPCWSLAAWSTGFFQILTVKHLTMLVLSLVKALGDAIFRFWKRLCDCLDWGGGVIGWRLCAHVDYIATVGGLRAANIPLVGSVIEVDLPFPCG